MLRAMPRPTSDTTLGHAGIFPSPGRLGSSRLRAATMVVDTGGAQALTSLEQARQRLLNEWVTSADGQASSRAEALMLEMAGLEVPADRYGFTARAG